MASARGQHSRRVIWFILAALAVFALAGAWFHHLLEDPSVSERAREKAAELKERARSLTH
jgi:hypothetical protein